MADSTSRDGARYASPEINDYVHRVHAAHDAGLARAFATPSDMPAIQLGQSEGRLLHLLVKLVGGKRLVEVGTLAGYSAIQLASALPAGGHLWTIEFESKHAAVATANLAAAGLADRVTVEVGAGVDVLPRLEPHGPFDVMFIDADKQSYDRYGRWGLAHVRKGGLVIGDNAYFFGRLLEDSEGARAMRAFHEAIAAACDSVCVPTPDGLVIGIVK
ncbi:MAG TPA: class I SAM-dependent methyltransferase [Kofleriaceae bacterium]|nr:class I SAM-dependent methyltransferase [Kofleriaceae bacterium]